MPTSPIIKLATAVAITTISERTWWRRIEQGSVTRCVTEHGKQAYLLLSDVLSAISISVTSEDIEFILRADAGDADAQNDVGQMFLAAGKSKAALYWFQQSANKENSDSMQWLGQCYAKGEGVPLDENLSVMWLAKAASLGHVIAKGQMDEILKRSMACQSNPSHSATDSM